MDTKQSDTLKKRSQEVDAQAYRTCSREEVSDVQLLDALARGCKEAMEPLYHRYNRLLFSLTRAMVGDPEVTANLVQEAFFLIWQRASTYSPQKAPVMSWLVAIMHNHTVDYLRKEGRHVLFKEVAWDEVEWEQEGALPDVWEEVWDNEQRQQVRNALQHLSPEQRLVIGLAFFQGWTHAEIAQRCGIPPGTVKSRLRLGLLRLRLILITLQEERLC